MHVAAMGKLRMEGADGPRQQQPLALLCYLALAGPKTREHLATVFWPEAKRPLNNLSSALTRIRRHLPSAITVEMNTVTCSLESDAVELQQAIGRLDAEAILECYQGHFCESTSLRMGLELEEWVFSMREALAVSASTVLLQLAEERSCAEAGALAARAYQIGRDFWIDERSWERCYELVADDVGLAERVRVDAAQHGFVLCRQEVQQPRTPRERSSASVLYGRSEELATLDAFHASRMRGDAPLEWLAIVGMGGVGKTALATAWLRRVGVDAGAVAHLVEAGDLRTAAQLAEALASVLGIGYESDATLLDALRATCSTDEPTVLVLDNLEQIARYDSFLRELAMIGGLTVVVTTRVTLGDDQERTLQLDGLIDGRASAAHAMFTAKALPVCPEVAEYPAVVEQACTLLAGHPLAIELFTAWLRTIPLHVAVDSLAASDELVADSPQRSLESMASLLDRSWALLDDNRAQVLARLALFEGPFGYDDAIATTGASLATLSELINSSLLSRRNDELLLHPLVRSYAAAKLRSADPLAIDEAERCFVEHFRAVVVAAADALRGPEAGKASPTLAAAFVNVQSAWEIALGRADWQAIGDMADAMALHLKSQSRLFLSAQLFCSAMERLTEVVDPDESDPTAAKVLVAIGWRYAMTRLVQGDRAEAMETVERCTLLCHPTDHSGQMSLLYMRGQIDSFAGRYSEAADHFAQARLRADDTTQEWFVAEIETGQAMVAMALDELDEARRLTRSVLETGRRLENPVIVSDAYYCLGSLDLDNDPASALVLLTEACEVAESASLTQMSRKYASVIGRCHVALADPHAAISVFERALAETVDGELVHEPWVRIANQTGLATALSLTGRHQSATKLLREAVRGVTELDDWPLMLETVLEICRLRTNQSTSPPWRDLVHIVASHDATMWRAEARSLLENAGGGRDTETVPGRDTTLGQVAELALLVLQE